MTSFNLKIEIIQYGKSFELQSQCKTIDEAVKEYDELVLAIHNVDRGITILKTITVIGV